uniref:Uncharacterized protein n=1 Tax=Timema douglasi TaxID=61478 RepID=A0A7R8Z5P8_TIMDO|nr:unnamed protein product [Timema douglasi]
MWKFHDGLTLVSPAFVAYLANALVVLCQTAEDGEIESADACSECRVCGGYRLLPCAVCNGSKKSVHRNDFTAEFVALKCMNCDEVGLVKCYSC